MSVMRNWNDGNLALKPKQVAERDRRQVLSSGGMFFPAEFQSAEICPAEGWPEEARYTEVREDAAATANEYLRGSVIDYESLTIADNFIFCKIMENDPDLCAELIEMITGIRVEKLTVRGEASINVSADSHGIRLDVYVTDEKGVHYDIEMQTVKQPFLPKRTRYYQSTMDINMLRPGDHYSELKQSYVIFISTFDPFERGLHRYTFRNVCIEDPALELKDETSKVFICTAGDADDVSEEMKAFLAYVAGSLPATDFTRRLDDRVRSARRNRKWRIDYMTYEMHLLDEYVRGQIAGRAEGQDRTLTAVKWLISQGRSEEVGNLKDNDFLEQCLSEAEKETTMETANTDLLLK